MQADGITSHKRHSPEPPVTRQCRRCGRNFVVAAHIIRERAAVFCSRTCSFDHTRNDPDRFWRRVERSDDCWLWSGATLNTGYGSVRYQGKHWLAHRLAFALGVGPITDDMDILHSCDNPRCCRPSHLRQGTAAENARDMTSKGRNGTARHPDTIRRGMAHHSARITPEDSVEIRRAYAAHEANQYELAGRFHVRQSTIWLIIHGKHWTSRT